MFCGLKLVLSNGVIMLPASLVVSVEINRCYFWSNLRTEDLIGFIIFCVWASKQAEKISIKIEVGLRPLLNSLKRVNISLCKDERFIGLLPIFPPGSPASDQSLIYGFRGRLNIFNHIVIFPLLLVVYLLLQKPTFQVKPLWYSSLALTIKLWNQLKRNITHI